MQTSSADLPARVCCLLIVQCAGFVLHRQSPPSLNCTCLLMLLVSSSTCSAALFAGHCTALQFTVTAAAAAAAVAAAAAAAAACLLACLLLYDIQGCLGLLPFPLLSIFMSALVVTCLALRFADDDQTATAMWCDWHYQHQTSTRKSEAMQKFLTVHVMLKGGEGEESMSLSCLRHWLQVTPILSLFQPPLPPLPPPPPTPTLSSLRLPVFSPVYVHFTTTALSHQNNLSTLSCLVNTCSIWT